MAQTGIPVATIRVISLKFSVPASTTGTSRLRVRGTS